MLLFFIPHLQCFSTCSKCSKIWFAVIEWWKWNQYGHRLLNSFCPLIHNWGRACVEIFISKELSEETSKNSFSLVLLSLLAISLSYMPWWTWLKCIRLQADIPKTTNLLLNVPLSRYQKNSEIFPKGNWSQISVSVSDKYFSDIQ